MNKESSTLQQSSKCWPIFGIPCAALPLLVIASIIFLRHNLADQIEPQAQYLLPLVTLGLATAAFVRRERIIWPIIGILLTSFYVALHFIPMG